MFRRRWMARADDEPLAKLILYSLTKILTKILLDPSNIVSRAINLHDCCCHALLKAPLIMYLKPNYKLHLNQSQYLTMKAAPCVYWQPNCDVKGCISVRQSWQTMPVRKSIQTAGSNYLFNCVALTGGGDVITLTKLNVRNVGKNNKHSFSDTTINVGDADLNHLHLKNGKDLNTHRDLLPVLEDINVL